MPKNKTEIKILSYSIVIVGSGFSPNNFDGDMLAEKEIIPTEWNWKVLNSVSSPIFAQIVYEKGKVNVRVEKNKITISDNFIKDNKVEDSNISTIAKRLIQRHKHLSFSALGINFETIIPLEKYENYIKDKFINTNKLGKGDNVVAQISVTMKYQLKKGGMLSAVLDEGILGYNFDGDSIEYKGIICTANFHRECANDSDLPLLIAQLNNTHIKEDKQKLISILQDIIE